MGSLEDHKGSGALHAQFWVLEPPPTCVVCACAGLRATTDNGLTVLHRRGGRWTKSLFLRLFSHSCHGNKMSDLQLRSSMFPGRSVLFSSSHIQALKRHLTRPNALCIVSIMFSVQVLGSTQPGRPSMGRRSEYCTTIIVTEVPFQLAEFQFAEFHS